MKSFCRIRLKLKPKYTRRTAGIFIKGLMFDRLVEEAFHSTKKSIRLGPSLGTPDVIDGLNPIEAKHTRYHIRSYKDMPEKWIQQLKLECVYCQVLRGWLLIGEIDTGLITAWEVTLTKTEFDAIRLDHLEHQEELDEALKYEGWNPDKNKEGKVVHYQILTPIVKECSSCFYNYEDGCPKRPNHV